MGNTGFSSMTCIQVVSFLLMVLLQAFVALPSDDLDASQVPEGMVVDSWKKVFETITACADKDELSVIVCGSEHALTAVLGGDGLMLPREGAFQLDDYCLWINEANRSLQARYYPPFGGLRSGILEILVGETDSPFDELLDLGAASTKRLPVEEFLRNLATNPSTMFPPVQLPAGHVDDEIVLGRGVTKRQAVQAFLDGIGRQACFVSFAQDAIAQSDTSDSGPPAEVKTLANYVLFKTKVP